jgi:hypothetical protein
LTGARTVGTVVAADAPRVGEICQASPHPRARRALSAHPLTLGWVIADVIEQDTDIRDPQLARATTGTVQSSAEAAASSPEA